MKALILREILTRWGRKNIGFLWLFGEQIIIFGFYNVFWLLRGEFSKLIWLQYKISIISFIILGHVTIMLWRNGPHLAQNAIWSNTALFTHANLKPLDFYLSRIFLEIISVTGAFLIAFPLLILLSIIPMPKNIPYMLFSWIILVWFTIGFSLTVGVLLTQYSFLKTPWQLFSLMLFLTSGAFYSAQFIITAIPEPYISFILWMPPLQINEMLRHGYYGDIMKTYENIPYLITVDLVLLFCGILLVNYYGKKLPQRL